MLDLSSFAKATSSLSEILERYAREQNDAAVRDAVVQRFEYTYELAYKIIKRYLETTDPNPSSIDLLSFQDLVRLANERGIIKGSVDDWLNFRNQRNITSHTYDEIKAYSVVKVAPDFLNEALFILSELENRNHD
ncbi:MAG: nucleotidyltransferase substrate binding protein [Candidatus Nomurabacteria bacterium]|jgi:nucleotidyltransferase substrate binding protein (TIGR01987 family)|nr:nucleotidyltransferase substrate binding protein [Candidatus Nomurabacteria bacterium]